MKRTVAIKLRPTRAQGDAFARLRATFASARNWLACEAAELRCVNPVRLHHFGYYLVRHQFPNLGAQMACNAIASVAQSMKAQQTSGRANRPVRFREDSSVHFDARTFRLLSGSVSIFTMAGRERVEMEMGAFQRDLLARGVVREAELVCKKRRWFLHVAIELKASPLRAGRVLGIDVGENVIAALSSGALFDGSQLRDRRDRFLALRKRLQSNGSESARRRLQRVSGREANHVRHVNHVISAQIVSQAVEGGYGVITMENLKNIRDRIRAGKRLRMRLHRWAWRQLQVFLEYKAEAQGLSITYVNPAFTSQTCAECGDVGTRRKHRFHCKKCAIFAHSDRNAARNIAKIGAMAIAPMGDVMHPHVALG